MAVASTILMIRPATFSFNAETAVNNFFQKNQFVNPSAIHKAALSEFDSMVTLLKEKQIDVL